MRKFLIIFNFICISIFAAEVKINEGIWINGDSFTSIKDKKNTTIYFSEWGASVAPFLKDENHYVALQLNESFDPLPKDGIKLPSLTAIAAISNESLRLDYFRFLENFGRTQGISHIILPDTVGFSSFEKEVIIQINSYSPFYFLNKSSLSFSIPPSKKSFEKAVKKGSIIWVVARDENISKLNRWSTSRVSDIISSLHNQLRESNSKDFPPVFELPESLNQSLFLSSVVVITPNHRFPLTDQVITYLGMDRQLEDQLKKYVRVLNHRMPNVICLVDMRDSQRKLRTRDIALRVDAGGENETAIILPNFSVKDEGVFIAKILFGIPNVVLGSSHPQGHQLEELKHLGYSTPDEEGFEEKHLTWIDSLAIDAIEKFATPGIQLAVVKNGAVVIEKSYGYYTYDSLQPVSKNTLYDIASITKVIATLPAIALLIDQGKINLDDSLSMHLDDFKGSNKSSISIRELLAHNAGLLSYVPLWKMVDKGLLKWDDKTPQEEEKSISEYDMDYIPYISDSLRNLILCSKLIKHPGQYTYSDVGFMILHLLVEQVSGQSFEKFLMENFYQPMGMASTVFNPTQKGIISTDIAPTEDDKRYRSYQVWGEVHDLNALAFGGISGHAGLFSSATDLAKMMAMFINGGRYGGKQFLSKATLDQFNFRHFANNRRGLGWDMKDGKKDLASSMASDQSYGHTGFTGTMVWADPEADLIYVFLSNRIYPASNNRKLIELRTRTYIHDVLYQSLKNFESRN